MFLYMSPEAVVSYPQILLIIKFTILSFSRDEINFTRNIKRHEQFKLFVHNSLEFWAKGFRPEN